MMNTAPLVDLRGAFDLHLHSAPEVFPRLGDDLAVARQAALAGLAGIVLKNHGEPTVGRACLAGQAVPEVRVWGGVVLNWSVGGINPAAAEAALLIGARTVWLPTVDAAAHGRVFGRLGGFGWQESGSRTPRRGLTVLAADGRLTPEARAIVELCRDHRAILGTGHLDRTELLALAEFATSIGFDRLLVNHPEFDPPNLALADRQALVGLGATLELCGGNLYPVPGSGRVEDYLATIAAVGAPAVVLASDAGQPRKSWGPEVLRVLGQCLLEKGISQDQINLMTKVNPARLLGL
jgi:hypothetical protein